MMYTDPLGPARPGNPPAWLEGCICKHKSQGSSRLTVNVEVWSHKISCSMREVLKFDVKSRKSTSACIEDESAKI